jgi:hypothetical protein
MNELTKIVPTLGPLHKVAIGLILMLAVAAGMNVLVAKPAQKRLAEKNSEVTLAKQNLMLRQAQLAAGIKREKAHGALTPEGENMLAQMNNRIFHAEEMAKIMDQVREMLLKNGATGFSFNQGVDEPLLVVFDSGRKSITAHRMPMRIHCTATYNQIEQAMAQLREAGMFISVDQMDISSKGDSDKVQAQFTLSLYYSKNEE